MKTTKNAPTERTELRISSEESELISRIESGCMDQLRTGGNVQNDAE